jgi:hypothetical protein
MDDSQNLTIQNGIPNSNKSKLGLVVVVMVTLMFSNLKTWIACCSGCMVSQLYSLLHSNQGMQIQLSGI